MPDAGFAHKVDEMDIPSTPWTDHPVCAEEERDLL